MNKKIFLLVTLMVCILIHSAFTQPLQNLLNNLTQTQNYVAKRISSFDRTGGNRDAFPIEPGETLILAELQGPAQITHIWCTIAAESFYSKKLVLRMYWDDEDNPSVEAPIGDFFGVGHGLDRNYASLPFVITSEGRARNSFWPMPFSKSAKITVINQGEQTVRSFYYYVDYRELDSLPKDTYYFHAQYRQDFPCKPGENYLWFEAEGEGHFVGVTQSIMNRSAGWWGEGDDMIWVDGVKHFNGTGSEDYFCDAWGMRESQSLFYGCPLQEPGFDTGDKATVYRWHIMDPIPFKKSFRATIEHGHANDRADDFSSVAFWYQKEPHKPFPSLPPVKERLPYAVEIPQGSVLFSELVNKHTPEGVDFSYGELLYYTRSGQKLNQVVFNTTASNNTFLVEVPVAETEIYTATLFITTGPDRGKIEVRLGNVAQAVSFDTYNPQTTGLQAIDLGIVNLPAGLAPLEINVSDKNPKSGGYHVGLVALQLTPKREFIRDWYIIGPFDNPRGTADINGLKIAYGPEKEFKLKKTYTGKDGSEIGWRPHAAPESGFVHFAGLYKPSEFTVAYALSYVFCPDERKSVILVGSDDGIRIWLNDELVHDNLVLRGAWPDQDRVPVTLKKGWNKILAKVEQATGGWGLYLRLPNPDGDLFFCAKQEK